MGRRAHSHAAMLAALLLLCGSATLALAQEAAPSRATPPTLRVRMVRADQASLPVAVLDGQEISPAPSSVIPRDIRVEPIDDAAAVPAQGDDAVAARAFQGDDATSLFDALVSPGRSIGGFDGPAWPVEDTPTAAPSPAEPPPVSLAPSTQTTSTNATPVRVPGSLAPTATAAGSEYVLGPGDVIEVFVWRNPELSREVPVRPDGRISLPLAGELVATGKSVEELQGEIATALSQYVQMPNVTVSVKQIRSLVVFVLGNVTRPGPVQMERSLTVLQAIAMAGGLNEFANRKDIAIMRTDEFGVHQRWTFRYDDVVGGRNLETNVSLRAGDVIVVP